MLPVSCGAPVLFAELSYDPVGVGEPLGGLVPAGEFVEDPALDGEVKSVG